MKPLLLALLLALAVLCTSDPDDRPTVATPYRSMVIFGRTTA